MKEPAPFPAAAGAKREIAGEAGRRSELVLRLLAGEPLAELARGSGIDAAALEDWRSSFVAAGEARIETDLGRAGGLVFAVELLGVPRVYRLQDGCRKELRWGLQRALMTFSYLSLAPQRSAFKDELEAALWPEAGEREVQRNFHPTLSAVRRTLAGGPLADGAAPRLLISHRGAYELVQEVDWQLDVTRFETAIKRGRELQQARHDQAAAECWEQAWRLYRGPLLAGNDAQWMVARRAELHRTYLLLLADLGRLYRHLGRSVAAIDAFRALLLQEPFEEAAHLALMELYSEQGRRDLVRRQFVRLQELLDELNVEPREVTQQRYYELMR